MILQEKDIVTKFVRKDSKIMSLDVSKNKLGVALSDSSLTLAFPYISIKREGLLKDFHKLKRIIEENEVSLIVIGLPLQKDGSSAGRVQSIKDFAKKLSGEFSLAITFQDERYSTHFVKRNFALNNKNDNIDEQAAAWFLQIFLDKLKKLV